MTDEPFGAMNPQRYARTKALFEVVCDLTEGERERILSQFALVDPDITEEVRRLLGYHDPVSAKVEGESAGSLGKNFPQLPGIVKPIVTNIESKESGYAASKSFKHTSSSLRTWYKRNLKFGSWPCFIIGGLILVTIFWLNRFELRRQLWVTRTAELHRVANTFEQSVIREIEENLQHFNQLANERRIRDAIDYMLSRKRPDSHQISPDAERRGYLARELILRKHLAMKNYGPVQFVLRNPEGFIIAYSLSTSNEALLLEELDKPSLHDYQHVRDGQPRIHLPHLAVNAEAGKFEKQFGNEGTGHVFSQVSYIIPLLSREGEIQAVLTVRDGAAADSLSLLCQQVRFGASGEVIPFDSHGYTLTTTRFAKPEVDREREGADSPSTKMRFQLFDPSSTAQRLHAQPKGKQAGNSAIQQASQAANNVLLANDYRGVPCLMQSRWLDEYGFGFLVKVDHAEAVALPATRGRLLLILLATLFLLALSVKLLVIIRKWRLRSMIGQMIGPYQVMEKIAEGGMGIVYKARHEMLGRFAAVKVLRKGMLDAESRKRFDREVRLVSRLRCKHTICIYDYGTSARGEPFFAMELLKGVCLDRAVAEQGPFSEAKTLKHMTEVAMSLREAHHLGIIHRDLAPQNLMLTTDIDGGQSMVVIDFGLAKPIGYREQSQTHGRRYWSGTPGYMSPERIRDPNDTDPRSDIFALGAVGFFMLTGQPPFAGSTCEETFGKILDGESCAAAYLPIDACMPLNKEAIEATLSKATKPCVEEPRQTDHHTPKLSVSQLILKCIARDATQRPQSMDEFLMLVQHLHTCGACSMELP